MNMLLVCSGRKVSRGEEESMQAVQFTEYGSPEVLQVVEVEEPHAGADQVRIAVRAAGVNGIDWKIRAGYMGGGKPLSHPSGTGMDAAGVVDEVGEGVSDVSVGDEVFGTGSATLAEYAVLSRWVVKPSGLSFEEAAGYPIPVETAIRILDEVGVQAGETLLVSGASGGVGSAVVQLARLRGITVIGTASERNQDYLRSLGANPTTYGDGLVDRVRDLAPNGVDAALDIAGSGIIPDLIELTGDSSRVLSIADFGAPEHGARVSTSSTNATGAMAEAARLFTEGAFTLPVEKTFPLEEAAKAQATSEAGHVAGRLVVVVS
jgi:NADPH:quinone reductase-like Zn-dependent oxidoreductase